MRLMRRHSYSEFGVLIDKLRGRTPGLDSNFYDAIKLLVAMGICTDWKGVKVLMTPFGEQKMYNADWLGRAGYDSKEDFWKPVIVKLDEILS